MKKGLALLMALSVLLSVISAAGAEQTVYTGTAAGFGGQDVTVEVTVEDGKIVGITVDDSTQSYALAGIAKEDSVDKVVAGILADGNTDNYPLDTVTGATFTTNAIITVANEALSGGPMDYSDVEIVYHPGTYTGKANGRGGEMTVDVTFGENRIENIEIINDLETLGVSNLPKERIPADIITYQSLGVDSVSGATLTSMGIINAVADAAEQAGANVAALRAVEIPAVEMDALRDLHTQIVIAGGGIAGLSAAATAANEGADVILVEKQPYLGGSLMIAGGGHATSNSKHLEELGADDSLESTMGYVYDYNKDTIRQPDYDFIEYVMSKSGEAVDYMIDSFDIPFTGGAFNNHGFTMFGTFSAHGYGAAYEFGKAFVEHGGTVLLNTTAEEILMEDGKVAGIKVSSPAGAYNIYADYVMIATGGANHDLELMLAANPELNVTPYDEQANVGNTGDGFRMLEEIGAQMGAGPYVKSGSVSFASAFRYTWANVPSVANLLVVNANGLRFTNEAGDVKVSKRMLRNGSKAYYAIYDAATISETIKADFDRFVDQDNDSIVVYADTIEELATKLGMKPEALKASYDRYNALCALGRDDDHGKPAANMIAYDGSQGYYAAFVQPSSWGTIGGVLTDRSFHVLKATDSTAFVNLYAIGEMATSTLFGDDYMGTFSLGYYLTAGHEAALDAVTALKGAANQ